MVLFKLFCSHIFQHVPDCLGIETYGGVSQVGDIERAEHGIVEMWILLGEEERL